MLMFKKINVYDIFSLTDLLSSECSLPQLERVITEILQDSGIYQSVKYPLNYG